MFANFTIDEIDIYFLNSSQFIPLTHKAFFRQKLILISAGTLPAPQHTYIKLVSAGSMYG